MRTHLLYTDQLLRRGYVDEVHVWDFCDKGNPTPAWQKVIDSNRAYLTAFFNATDLHPGYRYFQPAPPRPAPRNQSMSADTYLFAPYYEYYTTRPSQTRWADADVLIKADDDVVFLDLARFPSFVAMVVGHQRQLLQERPSAAAGVFYFPLILNNDVGLAIQGGRSAAMAPRCGARATALQSQYAYYAAKATTFDVAWTQYYPVNGSTGSVVVCPLSSWQCNATSPVFRDGLFERGDMAHALHRELLVDLDAYLQSCVYPRGPPAQRWSVSARASDATQRLVQLRRRVSINFMATTMATAREAFPLFLREHCCDDEAFVGRWPTLRQQQGAASDHVVDTAFAVVHFAFAPQYRTARPLSLRPFIAAYRTLALQMCNRTEQSPPLSL